MIAPNRPGSPGTTRRQLSVVGGVAVRSLLAACGGVFGYLVGTVTALVLPLPLALAGGCALLAHSVAGRWSRPALWGAAVGLAAPVALFLTAGS